jgi:hypothetical protein
VRALRGIGGGCGDDDVTYGHFGVGKGWVNHIWDGRCITIGVLDHGTGRSTTI